MPNTGPLHNSPALRETASLPQVHENINFPTSIDDADPTHRRSCKTSLALSIVMMEVAAAGMMMIGVREPGRYTAYSTTGNNCHNIYQTYTAMCLQIKQSQP